MTWNKTCTFSRTTKKKKAHRMEKAMKFTVIILILFSASSAFASACKNWRYWGCFCEDNTSSSSKQIDGLNIKICGDFSHKDFINALNTYRSLCAMTPLTNKLVKKCLGSGRSPTVQECKADPFPGCFDGKPKIDGDFKVILYGGEALKKFPKPLSNLQKLNSGYNNKQSTGGK